eukprot:EG_transcript_43690
MQSGSVPQALQLQQQLHTQTIAPKIPDIGSFVAVEHFATLTTSLREAQRLILQLCAENQQFKQIQAKVHENVVPRGHVRTTFTFRAEILHCDANWAGMTTLRKRTTNSACPRPPLWTTQPHRSSLSNG